MLSGIPFSVAGTTANLSPPLLCRVCVPPPMAIPSPIPSPWLAVAGVPGGRLAAFVVVLVAWCVHGGCGMHVSSLAGYAVVAWAPGVGGLPVAGRCRPLFGLAPPGVPGVRPRGLIQCYYSPEITIGRVGSWSARPAAPPGRGRSSGRPWRPSVRLNGR